MNVDIRALTDQVQRESEFVDALSAEAGKVIVGQRMMLERVLIGLLCNGHVLLEGVPGLAKTLTVRTIADSINATFMRIQFTPDLLPADLVGTMIYNQAQASFAVRKGPWKMHVTTQPGYGKEAPKKHDPPLLFNLAEDPSERFDLGPKHPDVIADLKKLLAEHEATVTPVENQLDKDLPK